MAIHAALERSMDFTICLICQKKFDNNSGGQLTNHLFKNHNISPDDYVVAFELKGLEPRCVCGLCNERPIFYRWKFRKFALGHNSFNFREKRYLELFGKPKCKVCDKEVNFYRGEPRQYCSKNCGAINTGGFSQPEVQSKIRTIVFEKYGVTNVSYIPEVQNKISKSLTGLRTGIKLSDEHKANIGRGSALAWTKNYDEHCLAISKGIMAKPNELKRRAESWIANINSIDINRVSSYFHTKVKKSLKLESFDFISEQIIFYEDNGKKRYFVVDELNENKKLIIEINGDYVHANPNYYKADDIITVYSNVYFAQDKWKKDKKRLEILASLGYKVLIIWESEQIPDIKNKFNLFISNS